MAHSIVGNVVLCGVLIAVAVAGSGCAGGRTLADDAGRAIAGAADDLPVPHQAPDLPVPGALPTTLAEQGTAIAVRLEEVWTSDLAADARAVVVQLACSALDLTTRMTTPDPRSAARDAVATSGTDPGLLGPVSGLTADLWSQLVSDAPTGDAARYALCGP